MIKLDLYYLNDQATLERFFAALNNPEPFASLVFDWASSFDLVPTEFEAPKDCDCPYCKEIRRQQAIRAILEFAAPGMRVLP